MRKRVFLYRKFQLRKEEIIGIQLFITSLRSRFRQWPGVAAKIIRCQGGGETHKHWVLDTKWGHGTCTTFSLHCRSQKRKTLPSNDETSTSQFMDVLKGTQSLRSSDRRAPGREVRGTQPSVCGPLYLECWWQKEPSLSLSGHDKAAPAFSWGASVRNLPL